MEKWLFRVPTCQALSLFAVLASNLLPTKQALYAAKLGLERRKQGFGRSHVVSGFYRQKPPGTLRYGYPVSTAPYLCSVKP